ncbi:MAG: hydroxymethylglutaryl-CoA lyase, partial [Myxococcota bacterium]|nr:hydroxymethylglutaryl-CoA lyase [Myxococcota bacterium]
MGSDVRIFEVGPRDGLQNESAILSVEKRAELIKKLIDAGARDIEVGSFVHPRWVPQMADTDALVRSLEPVEGVNYWSLIPNMKGMERALEVGVTHAAFFISASDTHNRKNLNKGIEESLHEFEEMFAVAKQHDLTVRAYVSMVFGCPYEGQIDFGRVMDLSGTLLEMGAAMISLGDTVGIGTPVQVRRDCARAIEAYGEERIALHLHDTRGMGVTNAMVAYDVGMRCFDSSVGGIGGCPFAPGAAGNLGTEDLLYLLDSLGVNTGMSVA